MSIWFRIEEESIIESYLCIYCMSCRYPVEGRLDLSCRSFRTTTAFRIVGTVNLSYITLVILLETFALYYVRFSDVLPCLTEPEVLLWGIFHKVIPFNV